MKLVVQEMPADPTANVEMSPSVIKILQGALQAIASRGAKRLSMSDIIDASGVSRGTLYRYFSSKDDVLAAVAEFICVGFEQGILAAGQGIDDPLERMRAVMHFYSRYTQNNTPDRMFEVEPAFHFAFFRSRFDRYKAATAAALATVFEHFEQRFGQPIDREAIVETLVRVQLSSLLVPASPDWVRRWNESPDRIEAWLRSYTR